MASRDVITIYDGANKQSETIGQLCGHTSFTEILSTGQYVHVTFTSESSLMAKGFKGEYTFMPVGTTTTTMSNQSITSSSNNIEGQGK